MLSKITNDIIPDAFERFENEYSPEQEIVRCMDCKYWVGGGIDEKDNFIPPRCALFNSPRHADWFCASGEKK